jgi:hypothetical protein
MCRAAHLQPASTEITELDVDLYKGGIALWGAVPAVYDTTRLPVDNGIHVHTRQSVDSKKEIDGTFPSIRIVGMGLPNSGLEVSAIDAIYYMVSSVFGFEMKQVLCTHCGAPHLDRDWFSLHPHRRHLCSSCGNTFSDTARGVGNPICGIRDSLGIKPHQTRSANRSLSIGQSDFPGGIQVWGSNPALIWTSATAEEEGIHLHAFRKEGGVEPEVDETFSELEIDGVPLDSTMVRVLMAQNTLPHLNGRVQSIECSSCGGAIFSVGELGFTPILEHSCKECGAAVRPPGRRRKTIGNPLLKILSALGRTAPRAAQSTTLGLLPETP